ncbi:VanZ family protein [Intestinibacillus sp. Marseille-P6563]|jgi:glycopeptide antibiotics resistance protein|uniref:VanZ family protein n=1 Tax=Intestinibacillus sp. Marseille-P6563 TaxID=2364792 RepID=UPI000F070A08|nr:VanZ family protein [Intestinibacillus sp. Marseille-P6563]
MRKKSHFITPVLFLLYLVLLVWIILFKLQFSIADLDRMREINLIPFYYKEEVSFHATEVLENVLIFVPFGIYLCLIFKKLRFSGKLFLIAGMSVLLELCQYVLAVGRSDVTDLITNVSGGLIGVFLYNTIVRLFHNQKRVDQIIIISATIVTVIVGGGLLFLLAVN